MTNTMMVRHTENYSRFHLLPSINRGITGQRVTKMHRSVSLMGCIRPVVIAKLSFPTGVEHDYVLDGQSLVQALIRLGLPIPYVYIETGDDPARTVAAIAMLNSTSKKWELKDYVHAWKYIKDSYVQLEQYSMRYSIHYSGIVCLAMNIEDTNESAPIIKDGAFEITNANFHNLVGIATDLLGTEGLGDVQRLPNTLAAELVRYYNNVENYDHEIVKRRIVQNIALIRATSATSVKAVLREHIFIIRLNG